MNGHHEGGSTRARIQAVALDLFNEQGYEKTSLREIADRLGVTKAALYYHFKTKDDIVVSCVEDFLTELDNIVDWGQQQPACDQTRHELIERYADVVLRRHGAMRFFQQNPSAERVSMGLQFKERMHTLHGLLADPSGPLTQRIRALAAVASLHLGSAVFAQEERYTAEELREAVTAVSRDLVTCGQNPPG